MSVGVLSTEPFHGYAVIFSPFSGDKLSVVGGVNYGLAGPGGMIVYQDEPGSGFKEIRRLVFHAGQQLERTFTCMHVCMQ